MNCKTALFVLRIYNNMKPRHVTTQGHLIYDYSKTNFIKSTEKLTIICKVHGEFSQYPHNHLGGTGCRKCHTAKIKMTVEEFINRASVVHSNQYSYARVNYKGALDNVTITCKVHGDFEQTPSMHLSGQGCKKCYSDKQRMTLEQFIQSANSIHSNKYDYSLAEYKSSRIKLKIICRHHGEFEQIPNSHLSGQGCPVCGNILRGYTRSDFKAQCLKNNKGKGTLYILKCYSNKETFYKTGITSMSVRKRYNSSNMTYKYKILKEIVLDSELIYDLENYILKNFAHLKYIPNIPFGGCTECFSEVECILDYVNSLY